jgi:hypothetical protein
MQVKPIFLIRFPNSPELKDKYLIHYEMLTEKLPDYNVLALMESGIDRVEFECYNALNSTEKDIEELKAMAFKILNQNEK